MRFFMTHAFEQNVMVLSGGTEKPLRRRSMDHSYGSNSTLLSFAETSTSSMTSAFRTLSSKCCMRSSDRQADIDASASDSGSDQSLDISIHSMLALAVSHQQQRQMMMQQRRLLSRAKPSCQHREMTATELLKLASLSQREGMSAAELLRSLQEIHESCGNEDKQEAAPAPPPADPYSTFAQLVAAKDAC